MGKTILISSHILTELADCCTSIGIIERGRLVFAGSIEEAYARVKGGERVLIRLEASERLDRVVPSVAATLGADDRVASAEADPDKPGTIRVELEAGEHGHHFLIERVIEGGGRIGAFEPQGVNLEDAFLKLTKGAVQ